VYITLEHVMCIVAHVLHLFHFKSDLDRCQNTIKFLIFLSKDRLSGKWCSQKFLSIGQFPNLTMLRFGQQWAIKKSIELQFFKTFYLFQSWCLLKRKVNNSQSKRWACSVLCTTSQRFFNFKMSHHLLCENCQITTFFIE
jgi:hypothetical protein